MLCSCPSDASCSGELKQPIAPLPSYSRNHLILCHRHVLPFDLFKVTNTTASSMQPRHCPIQEVSIPSSKTPGGILPSLKSFSSRVISAKLFAFRIIFSNRAFSFAFSLIAAYDLPPLAPLVPSVVNAAADLFERVARTCKVGHMLVGESAWKRTRCCFRKERRTDLASSEGSASEPKSSAALLLSESLTFWKSRNRTEGHLAMIQYR